VVLSGVVRWPLRADANIVARRHLLSCTIALATIGAFAAVALEISGGALHRAMNPSWPLLAAAFVVVALAQPLRAMAWRATLRERIDFGSVYTASSVGSFLDTVLPARLGEASKVGVLRVSAGRRWPGFPRAAGSLLCAHLLEAIAFVSVGAAAAFFLPLPSWARWALVAGFGLAASAIGAAALLHRYAGKRMPAAFDRFFSAAAAPPRVLVHAGVILLATWVVRWLGMVLLLHAFGVQVGLGAGLAYLIVTGLANTAPILPGNAGVYQGAATGVLALIGQAGAKAVAVALVAPVFASLVTAAAALVGVAIFGRSRFGEIRQAAFARVG
jgi:uncharacterized membrane protein YbhN (UPF0104 family)